MKTATAIVLAISLMSANVMARDTLKMIDIQEALESADFQAKLGGDIKFYWGDQPSPKVAKQRGRYSSNKKTNAFNKSDLEACQWAFLSALLSLEQRARSEGGNAVVNIQSYYKKQLRSSRTEVECHAGAFVAGVALSGEVVTLK